MHGMYSNRFPFSSLSYSHRESTSLTWNFVLCSLPDKPYQPERFDIGGGLASLAKTVSSLGFAKGGQWEFEATVCLLFRNFLSTFPFSFRKRFST